MTDSPSQGDLEAVRAYRELQRKARDQGRTTEELLVLYLLEAFLRRLSRSDHRTRFVLKGGVLLSALGDRRPTRDIDFQARHIAIEHERFDAGTEWWTPPPATRGASWNLVFRTATGRPIQHSRDHKDWQALLVAAGVRRARLHDARHTAATLLLEMKVKARVVKEILGHSSIGLTMNTYSL